MKPCFHIILILFLSLAQLVQNAYADITCSDPKLSNPKDKGSIYHFKAVITCNLVDETIDISSLKNYYRDEMLSPKSQFKINTQSDYNDQKGMTGYMINATQSYNTKHGHMSVRADFIFADDKKNTFYMDMHSKSVSGQGDNSYNKTIINQITLKVLSDKKAELTVTKEVDVEEPWYAPTGVFFDTVNEELVESLKKSALANAKKISGEKVDGLRK